jgi:hypothetical protein
VAGTAVVETQWFVARAAAAAGGPIIDEAVVVAVVLLPTYPLQYFCDWRSVTMWTQLYHIVAA